MKVGIKMVGKISEAEMTIMEVIWASDKPLNSAQIMEQLPEDKSWKQTTVLTLAKRLTQKQVIVGEKQGKTLYYKPLLTREAYKSLQSEAFLEEVHGGSIKNFIASLYNSRKINRKDIEALRAWFEEEE